MAKFVTPEVLNTYGLEIKNYIDAHGGGGSGLPVRVLTTAEYNSTAGILNTLYTEFPNTTFYFEVAASANAVKTSMGILTINKRTSGNYYFIAGFCRTGSITGAHGGFATIYKSGITEADMSTLRMVDIVSTITSNDYSRPLMPRFDTQIATSNTQCLPVCVPSSSSATTYQTRPSTLALDGSSQGTYLSKAGSWNTPTFNYNIPAHSETLAPNAEDGSIQWEHLDGKCYFNAQNIVSFVMNHGYDLSFVINVFGGITIDCVVKADRGDKVMCMYDDNGNTYFEFDKSNVVFLTDNSKSIYWPLMDGDFIYERNATADATPQSQCKFVDFRHPSVPGGTITTDTTTGTTDLGPALLFATRQSGGIKLYKHKIMSSNYTFYVTSTKSNAYTSDTLLTDVMKGNYISMFLLIDDTKRSEIIDIATVGTTPVFLVGRGASGGQISTYTLMDPNDTTITDVVIEL